MRIAHDVLARYVSVTDDVRELRLLLDDLGLEVKRAEHDGTATVFTLELLANRGDHHCYEGVAREIAVRSIARGAPCEVAQPEVAAIEIVQRRTGDAAQPSDPWPVRVESALSLVYTATLLERVGDGALDPDAIRLLEGAGIHTLGPAVDATNLVNLELGQPTHAFDADTIEGAIVVRESRPGEEAWPLFQERRVVLPEGTLVIADDVKILAVAGVIGCQESRTTEQTRRLLLESATFDPVAVRKASRALNVHTDSSARFERGADPTRATLGAARVVHLLEGAGFRRVGPTISVSDWEDPARVLTIDVDAANAFLETRLARDQVSAILAGHGFTVREDPGDPRVLSARVPPHRLWDVENVQDVYEELVKAVGYNDTPIGLPGIDRGAVPTDRELRRRRVDDVLTGLGFYEVFTDGFYGRHVLELLGADEGHPLHAHVETDNALDRAYSLLKNNGLAQAVEAVAVNLHRRNADVKAFEWTRTFHPRPGAPSRDHSPCEERRILWAIASGTATPRAWAGDDQPVDPWFFKGLLQELAVELGLDLALGAADGAEPLSTALHPTRQATITLAGQTVGILGEVHPAVLKRAKIKGARPVYLEIAADALLSDGSRTPYVEPPSYHPIVRNLAFTLPYRFEAGSVAAWLHACGPDWLQRVEIVDLYAHAEAEGGGPLRTVTYALHYANPDAHRTAEEVNAATDALVTAVVGQFGEQGVRLR